MDRKYLIDKILELGGDEYNDKDTILALAYDSIEGLMARIVEIAKYYKNEVNNG